MISVEEVKNLNLKGYIMKNQRKLNEEVISCIIVSLMDLLKLKQFEKISVVEIIEHAGVSRNSFYRNFTNKEDILARHIKSITENFISAASIPVFEVSWGTYISKILKHMHKNRELVDILLKHNKLHLIRCIFDETIFARAKGKIDEHHIWFLSGGLYNLHYHWAENGYKDSPEKIAETFDKIVLKL